MIVASSYTWLLNAMKACTKQDSSVNMFETKQSYHLLNWVSLKWLHPFTQCCYCTYINVVLENGCAGAVVHLFVVRDVRQLSQYQLTSLLWTQLLICLWYLKFLIPPSIVKALACASSWTKVVLHGMPFGTFTVCALPTVMISLIIS
jgi:hypothetical protein